MKAKKQVRPWQKGNQRAKKPDPKTAFISTRITPADKSEIKSYGQAEFMAEAISRELKRRRKIIARELGQK